MRRVDVPGGGWVELREQADLRVGDKRLVKSAATAAISALRKAAKNLPADLPTDPSERAKIIARIDMEAIGMTFDDMEAMQQVQAAAIVAALHAWSFDEPLPTMATIWNMTNETLFEFLGTEVGSIGTDPVNFDPHPDRDKAVPTGRRSNSNGRSSGAGAEKLTPPPSSATASTSSAD